MQPRFIPLIRDSDEARLIVNISSITAIAQDPEDPATCLVHVTGWGVVLVRHSIQQLADELDA